MFQTELPTVSVEHNNASALSTSEQAQLNTYEVVIENGLQTFYEVGKALAEIRDGRLYRAEYGTFEDYCDQRWGVTKQRAYQLMDAAGVMEALEKSTIVDFLPANESQARPMASLEPEQQRTAWQTAIDTAPNGKVTAAHVERVVEQIKTQPAYSENSDTSSPKPHVSHNSGQNEWYTPAEIIEAARRVMGQITLDPASSVIANQIVQADYFYTIEDDGLAQDWTGCVWLNPPYSQPEIGRFADKVHQELPRLDQLCILVNNATETAWFQRMLEVASSVCLLRSRVKFLDMQLKATGAPLQGQVLIYVGANTDAFYAEFSALGAVLEPR